jgi:hypothetical protein
MLSLLALVLASASALALYAGSPHCMWPGLRGHPRAARAAGWALALAALLAWSFVLGAVAGLCAMLASWMLALVLQPALGRLFGNPDADLTARGLD